MKMRSILIMLIISISAGMLGAQIMVNRALKAHPGPLAGALAGAAEIARKRVELSPQQLTQLSSIEAAYQPRFIELRRGVANATLELAKQLQASPEQADAARTAALRAQQASGALQDESLAFLQDVRRLLNPAQRAILDQRIQALLNNTADST